MKIKIDRAASFQDLASKIKAAMRQSRSLALAWRSGKAKMRLVAPGVWEVSRD